MNTPLIIITGPTASGKTEFAIQLAEKIGGEIINCDVGQFYTPLTIGTAKPHWKREKIPHHLFDIVNEPINFTVVHYRERVMQLIQEIKKRGRAPLIVGGSLFYIKSLFFPPFAAKEKKEMRKLYTWEELHALDPERAQNINPRDTYRIQRAMEIWHTTGKLPSLIKPIYTPVSDNFILIYVTRNREELYKRINKRVLDMFNAGWLKEVQELSQDWQDFLKKKKIIGYADIIENMQNNMSKQQLVELIEIIQQKTRHYAKRQETFWRMLKKNIERYGQGKIYEYNLTLSPLHLYIDQLLKTLE